MSEACEGAWVQRGGLRGRWRTRGGLSAWKVITGIGYPGCQWGEGLKKTLSMVDLWLGGRPWIERSGWSREVSELACVVAHEGDGELRLGGWVEGGTCIANRY